MSSPGQWKQQAANYKDLAHRLREQLTTKEAYIHLLELKVAELEEVPQEEIYARINQVLEIGDEIADEEISAPVVDPVDVDAVVSGLGAIDDLDEDTNLL